MRIKICGINSAEALAAVVRGRADYAGFIFFPRSPRVVTADQAAAIRATQASVPPTVGLFVKPELAEIAAVLAVMPLDYLQIYGDPSLARAVRAAFGRPVWLARGVSSQDDLASIDEEAAGLDGLVIESKPPPGATRPGGNAHAIDWSLLTGWSPRLPWLLAGGLTPDNVAEAIARSGTTGVDVSSGVETSPGAKDSGLIRSFIEASRNAPVALPAGGGAGYEGREQGVP